MNPLLSEAAVQLHGLSRVNRHLKALLDAYEGERNALRATIDAMKEARTIADARQIAQRVDELELLPFPHEVDEKRRLESLARCQRIDAERRKAEEEAEKKRKLEEARAELQAIEAKERRVSLLRQIVAEAGRENATGD